MNSFFLAVTMMVTFLTGSSLLANQTLTLQPGGQAIIKAAVETTVVCQGQAAEDARRGWCKCVWGPLETEKSVVTKGFGLYKVVVLADGKKVEDFIGGYEVDKQACEKAMASHNACSQ